MIFNFITTNWKDIITVLIIFVACLLPIFPPFTLGFLKEYYDINQKKLVKQRSFNFFEFVPTLIFLTMFNGIVVRIGSKGMITLVLLIILGTDLFINKRLNNNDITLAIVSIIALYLEKVLDEAEELSVWKLFTWKSKKGNNLIPIPTGK